MTTKFNTEKPFETIANFCNNSAFFNRDQRSSFVEETRQYFAKKAYWDEDVAIPEPYKKRFSTDLATLLGTSLLPRSEKMRLLATVEKATKCHFKGLNEEFQVYQMTNEHESKLGTSWGWMSMGACRASSLKVPPLSSDTGITQAVIIPSDGLTPALRYTLDHIAHFLYSEKKEGITSLDIPLESLVDLFHFAVEKKIDPIVDCLIGIFKRISRQDHEKLSVYVVKYLDNPAFLEALLQIEEILTDSPCMSIRVHFNRTVKHKDRFDYFNKFVPSIAFESPSAVANPSYWWNAKKPFESIAQFTDRFSVLNPKEQSAAFATIRDFFFDLAQSNQNISPLTPERFSLVDLKFLLSLIPNDPDSKNFERHRFIAAIQKVTRLQFTALAEEDQVYPLEMRYTDSSEIPQDVSSGWIRKDFAKGSNLKLRDPNAREIGCGYIDAEPICLDQMNPMLALALQQVQYASMTFNEAEVAGKVATAFELLQFAEKWGLSRIKEATRIWLKETCSGKATYRTDPNNQQMPKLHSAVSSALHNKEFFKSMDRGADRIWYKLVPDTASLSEESIYHTLRYNLDDYTLRNNVHRAKELAINTIGSPNPKTIKALIKFSKEVPEEAQLAIDGVICDLISEYFGLHRQIVPYIYGTTVLDPELAIALDNNLDKEKMLELGKLLLNQPGIGQFFADIGRAEQFESLATSVRHYCQLQMPSSGRLADAFEAWSPKSINDPIPAYFSPLLNELIKVVSIRYQNKNTRVVKVLSALLNGEERSFSSFVKADPESFENSFRFYPEKPISVNNGRKLCAILASKDIQTFLVENGVTTVELFREFLDLHIAKTEIDLSLTAVENNLNFKQPDEVELKRIDGFVKELRSIPSNASLREFTSRTRELLSKCALVQEIKGTDMITLPHKKPKVLVASLTKAYARRTFLETLFPVEKQTQRKFISDRLNSFNQTDKSELQKREEFEREVKNLSFDAAQELFLRLDSVQAVTLFRDNEQAYARELMIRGLRAYLATKTAVKTWGIW